MKKNFSVLFALSFAALATTCINSNAILNGGAASSGKTSGGSETTETKEEKKEESSVNNLYNAELSLHSSEKNCTRYRNYGFKKSHLHQLVFDEMSEKDELERMHEGESVWKEIDSRTISDKPALFADMKDHRDFKHHDDAAGGRLIYIPFKIKIHVPAEVYQNSYVTFDFTQRYDPNWANVPYKRTYSEYIFSFGCGEDDSIVSEDKIEERRPKEIEFAGKGHVAPDAVDIGGITETRNTAAAQVRSCSVSGGKIKGATRERDVTFYFGYLLSVTAGSSGIAQAQRMKLCDNWVRLDNITIGEPPIAVIDGAQKNVYKDVNSAITAFNAATNENVVLQINKDVEISKPTEITGSGKITTNGHKLTTSAPITICPKQKNDSSSEQNLKFENVYLDVCAGSGEHPYTVTTGIDSKSHVVFDNCDFNNTKTNNCALYIDAGNDVLINNCHFSKEDFASPYIVLAKNETKGDGNTVTFKNTSFYEHNTNLIVDTTNDTNPTIKFSGNTISSRYNIARNELPIKLGSGIEQAEALDTKTCLYGSENGVTGFYTGESVIKVSRDGDKKFDINYVLAKNVLASSASKFTCASLVDNTTVAHFGYNNDLVVTKANSGKAVAQIVPVENTTQFKETIGGTYKHETKELSLEEVASHSLYVATYDSTSKTYEIPTSVNISITLSAGTGTVNLVDGQDYVYYDNGLIDFNISSLVGQLNVSVGA